MTTQLSKNFTLEELIKSGTAARTGISNAPTESEIEHAKLYLVPGLEQIRSLVKKPLQINSAFRSKAINEATPGSANASQHCKFEAADITCFQFGTVLALAQSIISSKIQFDQLIWEYDSWVHISFSAKPRRMVLTKRAKHDYESGLVNSEGKKL